LYNVTVDIGEEHNVAAEHPKVVARVEKILKKVRTGEATWPLKDKQEKMPF
jgi:hypothetical protein